MVGLGVAPTLSRPRWRERGSNRTRPGSNAFRGRSAAGGVSPETRGPWSCGREGRAISDLYIDLEIALKSGFRFRSKQELLNPSPLLKINLCEHLARKRL